MTYKWCYVHPHCSTKFYKKRSISRYYNNLSSIYHKIFFPFCHIIIVANQLTKREEYYMENKIQELSDNYDITIAHINNFPVSDTKEIDLPTPGKRTTNTQTKYLLIKCEEAYEYYHNIYKTQKNKYVEYLFCTASDGTPLTLYDCTIQIMPTTHDKLSISWERILYGMHVKNDADLLVKSATYKCFPKNILLFKNFEDYAHDETYALDNKKVTLKIEHLNKGLALTFTSTQPITIKDMDTYVLHFLTLKFLLVCYFPNIITYTYTDTHGNHISCQKELANYIQTTERHINPSYFLELKNEQESFAHVYDKWHQLNRKPIVSFDVFASTCDYTSALIHMTPAIYVQCIEGALNQFYSNSFIPIYRKKGIEPDDITLRNKLDYIINKIPSLKLLYNHEITKHKYDKFFKKAKGHRNLLSHCNPKKGEKIFRQDELHFAAMKLQTMFRLILLDKIGAKIENRDITCLIQYIDSWYDRGNKLI